jgi:hypothetical protein
MGFAQPAKTAVNALMSSTHPTERLYRPEYRMTRFLEML